MSASLTIGRLETSRYKFLPPLHRVGRSERGGRRGRAIVDRTTGGPAGSVGRELGL